MTEFRSIFSFKVRGRILLAWIFQWVTLWSVAAQALENRDNLEKEILFSNDLEVRVWQNNHSPSLRFLLETVYGIDLKKQGLSKEILASLDLDNPPRKLEFINQQLRLAGSSSQLTIDKGFWAKETRIFNCEISGKKSWAELVQSFSACQIKKKSPKNKEFSKEVWSFFSGFAFAATVLVPKSEPSPDLRDGVAIGTAIWRGMVDWWQAKGMDIHKNLSPCLDPNSKLFSSRDGQGAECSFLAPSDFLVIRAVFGERTSGLKSFSCEGERLKEFAFARYSNPSSANDPHDLEPPAFQIEWGVGRKPASVTRTRYLADGPQICKYVLYRDGHYRPTGDSFHLSNCPRFQFPNTDNETPFVAAMHCCEKKEEGCPNKMKALILDPKTAKENLTLKIASRRFVFVEPANYFRAMESEEPEGAK